VTKKKPETRPAPAAVLDREVYTEGEAARLLEVAPSTLHYWLEGGVRRGVTYSPIVRLEPKGSGAPLTWGEFVEAGLLRQYRERDIPMAQLRAFISQLRETLGIPYPLAHEKPWFQGRDLVVRAQQDSGLREEFWLVFGTEQLVMTYAGRSFLDRVHWSHAVAQTYRPHNDPDSQVLLDPMVRFGRPQVGGISTSAVVDEADAGSTDEELAEAFGLTLPQVTWALAYERTTRVA